MRSDRLGFYVRNFIKKNTAILSLNQDSVTFRTRQICQTLFNTTLSFFRSLNLFLSIFFREWYNGRALHSYMKFDRRQRKAIGCYYVMHHPMCMCFEIHLFEVSLEIDE